MLLFTHTIVRGNVANNGLTEIMYERKCQTFLNIESCLRCEHKRHRGNAKYVIGNTLALRALVQSLAGALRALEFAYLMDEGEIGGGRSIIGFIYVISHFYTDV